MIFSKPLLIGAAVLLATNLATGAIAYHAIKARGKAEAATAVATARANEYKANQERAEQAALLAQDLRRKADAGRAKALKRLDELERTQPDVKAWADVPLPGGVIECLHAPDCH